MVNHSIYSQWDETVDGKLPFDVAVVGAGSTGAGVALDAASRGLSVVLVDRSDVAAGTSSSSSRLIHGGLRYLESGEVSLVAEALRERSILQRIAPHLVSPLGFTIPINSASSSFAFAKRHLYSMTLWGYDIAGSLRSAPRHKVLSNKQVVENLPKIRTEHLHGGLLYPDSLTDDARLVNTVVRTAMRAYGAKVLTYLEVVGIDTLPGGSTLHLRSTLDPSHNHTIDAKVVVVAAGVSNQRLGHLFEKPPDFEILPAKGVHLAVDRGVLPLKSAAAIDLRSDGRRVFVVPWGRYTYFGTTDTPYRGDVTTPDIDQKDVQYLLNGVNEVFSTDIQIVHVTGGWSGLRPLVKDKSKEDLEEVSRKHSVSRQKNVIFVAGGKLTTYREMAEQVTNLICDVLSVSKKSDTKNIPLLGSVYKHQLDELHRRVHGTVSKVSTSLEEQSKITQHLIGRYGAEAVKVSDFIAQRGPQGTYDLSKVGELYEGEIEYMVKEEGARTLSDLLLRRSRIATLDTSVATEIALSGAQSLSSSLNLSSAELQRQLNTLRTSRSTLVPKQDPRSTQRKDSEVEN